MFQTILHVLRIYKKDLPVAEIAIEGFKKKKRKYISLRGKLILCLWEQYFQIEQLE